MAVEFQRLPETVWSAVQAFSLYSIFPIFIIAFIFLTTCKYNCLPRCHSLGISGGAGIAIRLLTENFRLSVKKLEGKGHVDVWTHNWVSSVGCFFSKRPVRGLLHILIGRWTHPLYSKGRKRGLLLPRSPVASAQCPLVRVHDYDPGRTKG